MQGGIELRAFQHVNEDAGDLEYDHDRDCINALIDGGNFRDDFTSTVRRQQGSYLQNMNPPNPLPFQVMYKYVDQQGFQRPAGGRRV